MFFTAKSRGAAAIACLVALFGSYAPAFASSGSGDSSRVLALLNTGCSGKPVQIAQFNPSTPTPSPSPSSSASPTPFPSYAPPNSTTTIYQTPRPQPGTTTAPVTPPPVPTATPNPFDQNQTILLQRGGNTPPPITPAGQAQPAPTAQPTGVPTLKPNGIAILADKVSGNTNQGEPGDADGNVHILYGAEEIVGDHAHYDGLRTVTITGHPFIVNRAQDSVLLADEITFDTIDQTAKLTNGRGTSSQGVERGLVHFQAKDLHTDADGIGHGLAPMLTTCENSRSGYHITGRNMDVIPGDKIVIYRAILWLGAAAVFWLPKVVIPLRTVDDSNKPKYFPDVGYDQYEGFWIKTRVTFGRNQYYYGYYTINYYTKVGTGLGYDATLAKRSGHRSGTIHFYTINDKRVGTRQNNFSATENENFSQTLHGNFGLNYVSNFGPYTNLPATTGYTGTVTHAGTRAQQSYSFSYNSVGSQSKSGSYSFSDSRQFKQNLSNTLSFSLANSASNYSGISSSNVSSHFNDVTHLTTSGADYMMTLDKTFAQQPYGINKLPELQIRPYKFLSDFHAFPIQTNFTVGEYSEPTNVNFKGNAFATQRADLAFNLGPMIAKVAGSDFTASMNVNQFAYGTGDMKASIQQNMSLITPLWGHIINNLTYNESNFNGPPTVPFQTLDQQSTINSKAAQDLVRIFNGNTYNLSLGFSTYFQGVAQPITYQLTAQPSQRSVVLLSGSFNPGPGNGFFSTNFQTSVPFGRDAALQFIGDLDWKNKGRIENKILYYTKTIGGCYQLQMLYNQSLKLVTVSINILAFPSRSATFNIGQNGPLIPTSFNNF